MRNLSLAAAMEAFVTRPKLLDVREDKRSDEAQGENKPEHSLPGRLDRVSQELSLFMSVDPILASLHKEYIDACALLDDLAAKGNSEYDAMATVASDRVESAHSAFSARLIELRSDETTIAMVKMKRHRLLIEEMEERREKRRLKEEKTFFHKQELNSVAENKRKQAKTRNLDMFMAFIMMSWAMHSQNRQELKYAFEDAYIGPISRKKAGTAA